MHVTELEESVCDDKTQFRAEREKTETAVANTMMTNDFMPYVVIYAYPDIKSPSNMIVSSFEILRRVEYNVSLSRSFT